MSVLSLFRTSSYSEIPLRGARVHTILSPKAMWISKLILVSLATVGYMSAQVPQVAEPQTAALDAFQHLPPMPSQVRQMPEARTMFEAAQWQIPTCALPSRAISSALK